MSEEFAIDQSASKFIFNNEFVQNGKYSQIINKAKPPSVRVSVVNRLTKKKKKIAGM